MIDGNKEISYSSFIDAVHNGTPVALGQRERIITIDTAYKMLFAFFIMLCRNPFFDAMGTYTNFIKSRNLQGLL